MLPEPCKPPARVLLCLSPTCHGEFYLPLDAGEEAVCPNSRAHPVAVYNSPKVFPGEDE